MSQTDGHNHSDLGQQVHALREQVAALEKDRDAQDRRIKALEQHAGITSPADSTVAATASARPAEVASTVRSEPVTPVIGAGGVAATACGDDPDAAGERGENSRQTDTTTAKPAAPMSPPVPKESTVDWLMRNAPMILTRLGIVGVVIGLAYAVGFSWQYFGPLFKIVAGFSGAAALVAGGEYISRRKDWGWYGQAITGGGYALAYFVVYAAQNIASVKIMDSALLSGCGLLGLAAVSMGHAIYRKSEGMALLSTLLAFGTISLSPISGFSVIASVILIAGLAVTIVKQRWSAIFAAGTLGSYLTYMLFTAPQIEAGGYGFWLSAGFLSAFWLAWNYVGFRLFMTSRAGTTDGGRLLPVNGNILHGVTLINGVAFLACAVLAVGVTYPASLYLLLAGVSAAYFATAFAARQVGWNENAMSSSLIALSLAAAATALKLDPTATMVVWFIEVPVLALIGLRAQLKSFKIFGHALGALALFSFASDGLYDQRVLIDVLGLTYNVLVGGFAAVALAVCALAYWLEEKKTAFQFGFVKTRMVTLAYSVASLGLVYALTIVQASAAYVAVVLAAEALALFAVALRYRSDIADWAAKFFMLSALACSVFTSGWIGFIQIAVVLAVNFAMAAVYYTGWNTAGVLSRTVRVASYLAHAVAGIVVALLLTWLKLDAATLPWAFAVEAVALLVAARLLRDPVVRLSGTVAAVMMALALYSTLGAWAWATVIPCVVALYAGYGLEKFWTFSAREDLASEFKALGLPDDKFARLAPQTWANAGTLLLSVALFSLLSWQTLAVALAIQGLCIMAAGFQLKEKQFFLSGLAIFAVLVGKLALFDLQGAETIWRIISFVSVGLTLLAAGYLNARFNQAALHDGGQDKNDGPDRSR